MEDERSKKLAAGRDRLAKFQKKKKKKRKEPKTEKQDTSLESAPSIFEERADAGDSVDEFSAGSSDLLGSNSDILSSFSEIDQRSIGTDDLCQDSDASQLDAEVARVELGEARSRIHQLEESLLGKQTALTLLQNELSELRAAVNNNTDNGTSNVIENQNDQINGSSQEAELRAALEQYNIKIQEFQQALQQRDQVIEQLTVNMQAVVQSRDAAQEEATAQTNQLSQYIQTLQDQLKQTGEALRNQSGEQMSSLADELTLAQTQVTALQQNVADKDAIMKQLADRYTLKAQEVIELAEERDDLKRKSMGEISALQQKLKEVTGESSPLDKDDSLLKLQAELDESYGSQIVMMKQQLDETHKQELALWKQRYDEMERIAAASSDSNLMRTELENQLKEANNRLADKDEEILKAKGDNENLNQKLSNLIAAHQKQVNELEANHRNEIDFVTEEAKKHTQERLEEIRQELESTQDQLNTSLSDLEEEKRKNIDAEEELAEKALNSSSLRDNLTKEIGILANELKKKDEEIQDLNQVRKNLEDQLNKITTDHEESVANYKSQITDLSTEYSKLQAELAHVGEKAEKEIDPLDKYALRNEIEKELQSEYEDRFDDLNIAHEAALQQLRNELNFEHENALKKEKLDMQTQLEQKLESASVSKQHEFVSELQKVQEELQNKFDAELNQKLEEERVKLMAGLSGPNVNRLQAEVRELSEARDALMTQIDSTTLEKEVLQEELLQVMTEKDTLVEMAVSPKELSLSPPTSLEEAQLTNDIEEMRESLVKTTQEKADLEKKISELEKNLSMSEDEKQSLADEIENMKRLIGDTTQLAEALEEMTIQRDRLLTDKEELQHRIEAQEKDHEGKMLEVLTAKEAAEAQLVKMETEMTQTRKLSEPSPEIEQLQETLSELARLQEKAGKVELLEGELTVLRDRLQDLEEQVCEGEVGSDSDKLEVIQDQLVSQQNIVSGLTEELRLAQEELQALKGQSVDMSKWESEVDALQKELKSLQMENVSLLGAKDNLAKALDEKEHELHEMSVHLSDLEANFDELKRQNKVLESKSDQAEELEELRVSKDHEMRERDNKIDLLQQQLQGAQDQLSRVQVGPAELSAVQSIRSEETELVDNTGDCHIVSGTSEDANNFHSHRLECSIEELKSENDNLKSVIAEKEKMIQEFLVDCDQKASQIQVMTTDIELMKRMNDHSEEELNAYVNELEHALQERKNELDILANDVGCLDLRMNNIGEQISVLEIEKETLLKQVEDLQQNLVDEKLHVSSLNEKVINLMAERDLYLERSTTLEQKLKCELGKLDKGLLEEIHDDHGIERVKDLLNEIELLQDKLEYVEKESMREKKEYDNRLVMTETELMKSNSSKAVLDAQMKAQKEVFDEETLRMKNVIDNLQAELTKTSLAEANSFKVIAASVETPQIGENNFTAEEMSSQLPEGPSSEQYSRGKPSTSACPVIPDTNVEKLWHDIVGDSSEVLASEEEGDPVIEELPQITEEVFVAEPVNEESALSDKTAVKDSSIDVLWQDIVGPPLDVIGEEPIDVYDGELSIVQEDLLIAEHVSPNQAGNSLAGLCSRIPEEVPVNDAIREGVTPFPTFVDEPSTSDVDKEFEKLWQEVGQLKEESKLKEDELLKMEQHAQLMSWEREDAQREIEETKNKLSEAMAELEKRDSENAALLDDAQREIEETKSKLGEAIAELEKRGSENAAVLDDARREIEETHSKLGETVAELEKRDNENAALLDDAKREIEETNSKLVEAVTELEKRDNENAALLDDLDKLRKQLECMSADKELLQDIPKQLETVQGQKDHLESELSNLKEAFEQLETKEQELVTFQKDLVMVKEQLQIVQGQKDHFESDLAKMKESAKELEAIEQENIILQEEMAKVKEELTNVMNDRDAIQEQRDCLESQVSDLKDSSQVLEEERDDYCKELEELKMRLLQIEESLNEKEKTTLFLQDDLAEVTGPQKESIDEAAVGQERETLEHSHESDSRKLDEEVLSHEIRSLRDELEETKEVYSMEQSLLKEALETDKSGGSPPTEGTEEVDHVGQVIRLTDLLDQKEQQENKILTEKNLQISVLQEANARQEKDIHDLTSQLEEVEKQLRQDSDNKELTAEDSLADRLDESMAREELLMKEKDLLLEKIAEQEEIHRRLVEEKEELQRQLSDKRRLEELLLEKDRLEQELSRQKSSMEGDLHDLEVQLTQRENHLLREKCQLQNELKQKDLLLRRWEVGYREHQMKLRNQEMLLEKQYSEQLSKVQEQLQEGQSTHLEKLRSEIEKRHAEAIARLRRDLHQEFALREARLNESHLSDISMLKSQHNSQLKELLAEAEARNESLRQELELERQKHMNGPSQSEEVLEDSGLDRLQMLKQCLDEGNQKILDEIIQEKDHRNNEKMDQMKSELETKHKDELDSLKATAESVYSSQLEEQLARCEQEKSQALLDQLGALQQQQQQELDMMRNNWAEKEQEYEKQIEEKDDLDGVSTEQLFNQLQRRLYAEHQQVIQDLARETDQVSLQYLEALRLKMEDKHHEELEQDDPQQIASDIENLKKQWETDPQLEDDESLIIKRENIVAQSQELKKKLEAVHSAELANLRAALQADYDMLIKAKEDLEKTKSQTEQGLKQELEGLREAFEDLQQKYADQRESAASKLAGDDTDAAGRLNQLQSEVEELQQELTQQRKKLQAEHTEELTKLKAFFEKELADTEEKWLKEMKSAENLREGDVLLESSLEEQDVLAPIKRPDLPHSLMTLTHISDTDSSPPRSPVKTRDLEAEFKQQLRSELEKDYLKGLENLRNELENEHKAETARISLEYQLKHEEDLNQEKDALTRKHEHEKQLLEIKHLEALDSLRKELDDHHARLLARIRMESAGEMAKMVQEERDNAKRDYEVQLAEAIEEAQQKSASDLEHDKEEALAELKATLGEEYSNQLQAVQEKHQQEIEELTNKGVKEQEELKAAYDERWKEEKAEMDRELEDQLKRFDDADSLLEQLRENQEQEKARLKEELTNTHMEKFKEVTDQLEEDHLRQLSEMRDKTKQLVEEEYVEKLRILEGELEREKSAREEMRLKFDQEVEEMNRRNTEMTEKINKEFEDKLKAVALDSEHEIENAKMELEEAHQKEIEELQAKHLADMNEEKGTIDALQKEIEAKEAQHQEIQQKLLDEINQVQEEKASLVKNNLVLARRKRENEETNNLITMLRSDLDNMGSEREQLQLANNSLLRLLSQTVTVMISSEEAISRRSADLNQSSLGDQEGGARGDDESPSNTSIVTVDDGLEVSQQLAESMFAGPELDAEGEEFIINATSRLQSSVRNLLETIQQPEERSVDQEAQTTPPPTEQLKEEIERLEERLKNESQERQQLLAEIDRMQGLLQGLQADRDELDQSLKALEEEKLSLIVDLETARNGQIATNEKLKTLRLQNDQLEEELQSLKEQQSHLEKDQQALKEENDALQKQAKKERDRYQTKTQEMEAQMEEQLSKWEQDMEAKNLEIEDLHNQIQAANKIIKAEKEFLQQQTIDREQERDEFQKEIKRLEELGGKEKSNNYEEEDLRKQLKVLENENSDLRQTEEEMVLEKDALQKQCYEQLHQISALQSKLDAHKHGLVTKVEELLSDVDDESEASLASVTLAQQLEQERDALERKDKEIKALEEQLDQFRENLVGKEEEISQLKMQLDIADKTTQREENLKDQDSEVMQLKIQLDHAEETILQLEQQLTSSNADVQASHRLQQELNEVGQNHHDTVEDLQIKLEQAEKNILHLQEQLTSKTTDRQALQRLQRELNQVREDHIETVQELEGKLEHAAKTILQLQQQLASKTTDPLAFQRLQQELSEVQDDHHKAVIELQGKLESQHQEIVNRMEEEHKAEIEGMLRAQEEDWKKIRELENEYKGKIGRMGNLSPGKTLQQKLDEIKAELTAQHQEHIADIQRTMGREADERVQQIKSQMTQDLILVKQRHQNELEEAILRTNRDLLAAHAEEVSRLREDHRQEIERLLAASPANLIHVLDTDQTMQNGFEHRGRASSIGQELPSQADSGVSTEGLSDKLKTILSRLTGEGLSLLSLSELRYIHDQTAPRQVLQEGATLASIQEAWENERRALNDCIQALSDTITQMNTAQVRNSEGDGTDWRGELLHAIQHVFHCQRDALRAELTTNVAMSGDQNITHLQLLERRIRDQENFHKAAVEQIYGADRSSILGEGRDLHQQTEALKEELQRSRQKLTQQLTSLEDQSQKRERQLKRQLETMEHKYRQERILVEDLRTSLTLEKEKSVQLSEMLDKVKGQFEEQQEEMSDLLTKIDKQTTDREAMESRLADVTAAFEAERSQNQTLNATLAEERNTTRNLQESFETENHRLNRARTHEQRIIKELHREIQVEKDKLVQAEKIAEQEELRSKALSRELEEIRTETVSEVQHEKAKFTELKTALDVEKSRCQELKTALQREQALNAQLHSTIDQERQASAEVSVKDKSALTELQSSLDKTQAELLKVQGHLKQLQNSIQRKDGILETERRQHKETLSQERATTRQMKSALDSTESQLEDLKRRLLYEQEKSARLKAEKERLKNAQEHLAEGENERAVQREREREAERRNQLEREREKEMDRQRMRDLQLEQQSYLDRISTLETEVEDWKSQAQQALEELQMAQDKKIREDEEELDMQQTLEKDLQNSLERLGPAGRESQSAAGQGHFVQFKEQLEAIRQRLQLIAIKENEGLSLLRRLNQTVASASTTTAQEIHALERNLQEATAELRQIHGALILQTRENNGTPVSQSRLNTRLLNQNAELTDYITKLSEDKSVVRRQLAQLEEQLWNARHHSSNSPRSGRQDFDRIVAEERSAWEREKLAIQNSLRQAEREIIRLKLDIDNSTRESNPSAAGNAGQSKYQRLYGKYLRAESFRKSLVYQKTYLLLLLGGFQVTEEAALARIAMMGGYPNPSNMPRAPTRHSPAFTKFRSAVRAVIAVARLKYLKNKWHRTRGISTSRAQSGASQHSSCSPPNLPLINHSMGVSPPVFLSPSRTGARSSLAPASFGTPPVRERSVIGASTYHSQLPFRNGPTFSPSEPMDESEASLSRYIRKLETLQEKMNKSEPSENRKTSSRRSPSQKR